MGQFKNMKINTGKKGNNFKELIEYLIVIARYEAMLWSSLRGVARHEAKQSPAHSRLRRSLGITSPGSH